MKIWLYICVCVCVYIFHIQIINYIFIISMQIYESQLFVNVNYKISDMIRQDFSL